MSKKSIFQAENSGFSCARKETFDLGIVTKKLFQCEIGTSSASSNEHLPNNTYRTIENT